MKWYLPNEGAERAVRRFAWLPADCTHSNRVVWLAFVIVHQCYYAETGWVDMWFEEERYER